MRARRHDVGQMHEAFAAVAYQHRLMVPRMAAGDHGAHARDEVGVAIDRFEHRSHRRQNLRRVAICGAQSFVARIACDFEFALLHEDSRARERSFERAGIPPPHDSSAMIEMQMRHDQMRDVARLHPERAQMLWEPSVAVIEDLALDRA